VGISAIYKEAADKVPGSPVNELQF